MIVFTPSGITYKSMLPIEMRVEENDKGIFVLYIMTKDFGSPGRNSMSYGYRTMEELEADIGKRVYECYAKNQVQLRTLLKDNGLEIVEDSENHGY